MGGNLARVEQVTLEWVRYAQMQSLAYELTASVSEDFFLNTILVRMQARMLAQKALTRAVDVWVPFRYPSSPWQHYKRNHEASWWLGWLVRRRPVQEKTVQKVAHVEVDQAAVYPQQGLIDATLRDRLGSPLIIETIRQNWWDPTDPFPTDQNPTYPYPGRHDDG
jgi:hypothetical protein